MRNGTQVRSFMPQRGKVNSQGREPLVKCDNIRKSPEGAKASSTSVQAAGVTVPQSFGSLHCHIVFSTKNRKPFISPSWQARLYEYIGGILRGESHALMAAGGVSDHVHLLVSMSRTSSVADVVRVVKSNTSSWVHNTLGETAFQWQNGYGAFAVSYSNLERVKTYLANQHEHHQTRSFQEEYLELLSKHDIQWDERYVWD